MKSFKYSLIGCLALVWFHTQAQVVTYPASENIRDTNRYIAPSNQYAITLTQNGKTVESFVGMMHAMHHTNNSKTTSWTTFSFQSPVMVKVTRLSGTIDFCQVLPRAANITVQKQGNTVEFEITKPGQFSVEFQKGIKIEHPLLIFADPLEKDAPVALDTNVIYFGPGLHTIGNRYKVPSNKTIYLAGGSYVKGQFYSENGENIQIKGRGILSGEDYPARTADHMITLKNSRNILVEGITIIHAPRFMISTTGENHIIRNVKMMGWWFSTDGISSGENSLIEDCFFKVNDDAIKLYTTNTTARNCVIWQMENGAPFQIGWNGATPYANCYVNNIDIIRVEHEWDNENEAVFCAVHGGSSHKEHFLMENVRIDNSNWRIFHIVTKPNRWGDWNPEKGSISDIKFRNIEFYGVQKIPSLIMGHDEKHPIYDVTFENVVINGKKITASGKDIIIDAETTRNIVFH